MNSLIILMSGILLIAVIQFLCCFCRHVPVKLIPLVLLAVLSVWCFSFRIGREDELPLCSMANLLMLMLFSCAYSQGGAGLDCIHRYLALERR